jgi:hypothetical protein
MVPVPLQSVEGLFPMSRIIPRILVARFGALAIPFSSTFIKVHPKGFFWVDRANAKMPVSVRGNKDTERVRIAKYSTETPNSQLSCYQR